VQQLGVFIVVLNVLHVGVFNPQHRSCTVDLGTCNCQMHFRYELVCSDQGWSVSKNSRQRVESFFLSLSVHLFKQLKKDIKRKTN